MAVTAVSGSGALSTSGKSLAGTFDTFLQLLTTQLQQQDPLSPMDATQFTSQLVQFASVEQQIKSNDQLGKLADLLQSSTLTAGLGFLGAEVVVDPPGVRLGSSGDASFAYALPSKPARVDVVVSDASGRKVFEGTTVAGAGANTFTWDGRGVGGARQPVGDYRLSLRAVDPAGTAIAVDRSLRGAVTGIEPDAAGLRVIVGGVAVPTTAIREVRRPAA